MDWRGHQRGHVCVVCVCCVCVCLFLRPAHTHTHTHVSMRACVSGGWRVFSRGALCAWGRLGGGGAVLGLGVKVCLYGVFHAQHISTHTQQNRALDSRV